MEKAIFLDIDGVLVTPASSFQRSRTGAVCEPSAIQALNYLIAETGASVVITSTWRLDYTSEELREILLSWGLRAEIAGFAPQGSRRSEEIQSWLGANGVSTFVILDDQADMGDLTAYLVQTDFEKGLTIDDARKACTLLAKTTG